MMLGDNVKVNVELLTAVAMDEGLRLAIERWKDRRRWCRYEIIE